MSGCFELYRDAGARWRFRLKDDRDVVVASGGEAFVGRDEVLVAVGRMQEAAVGAPTVDLTGWSW